jgi:hypothetical protein
MSLNMPTLLAAASAIGKDCSEANYAFLLVQIRLSLFLSFLIPGRPLRWELLTLRVVIAGLLLALSLTQCKKNNMDPEHCLSIGSEVMKCAAVT